MKRKALTGLMVAVLLLSGSTLTSVAQGGPARAGTGCDTGRAPQNAEARMARQAACLERNGGVCPNGGPRMQCRQQGQGRGQCNLQKRGQGQGRGKCARRGLRDGTGPRNFSSACPLTPATGQK